LLDIEPYFMYLNHKLDTKQLRLTAWPQLLSKEQLILLSILLDCVIAAVLFRVYVYPNQLSVICSRIY